MGEILLLRFVITVIGHNDYIIIVNKLWLQESWL